MLNSNLAPRPASIADYSQLARLLNHQLSVHRHLDWRHALDWLGHKPFWVLEQNGEIVAALACPPDPADIAWIRLFFCLPSVSINLAWKILFEQALNQLRTSSNPQIAAVALQTWFAGLLSQNNFTHYQDIVILSWENTPICTLPNPPGILIRGIEPADLPDIAAIDAGSFEPLWVNSYEAVTLAYDQSDYATLAELDGQVMGYQLTTANPFNAHLARLAVSPQAQGHGLGHALVQDMMLHYQDRRIWQITVNTQSTNHHSLSLYQKIGFQLTGEKFPVYTYTA